MDTIKNQGFWQHFRVRLRSRLAAFYLITFLALEGGFGVIFWQILKEKENFLLDRHIEAVGNAYSVILNNYKLAAQIIYDEVINQPEIISLLEEALGKATSKQQTVRQQILKKLTPAYQRLRKHNLRQLHFHLPDSTSFLRFHRPEKFGDSLLDIRTSVRLTNQQKKFVYGFEEGRIYNGFRYVFPLFSQGKTVANPIHLGSVETSVSFIAFKNEMASLFPGCFTFILRRDVVDAKLFDEEKNNYVLSDISDRFVSESLSNQSSDTGACRDLASFNQNLHPLVEAKLDQGKPFAQLIFSLGKTPYVSTFLPVKNFEGQTVAYIISYEQDRAIEGYYQTFYWNLLGVTLTNILFLSFIAFVHRSYRLLQRNNDALKQEVHARITAEDNEREKAYQLAETLKELKLAQVRLVQGEKMSSLNRLVAGIAHEINNPISFIRGNLQPAEEYLESLLKLIDHHQKQHCSERYTLSQLFPDIDLEFIRQDFPRLLASMKQGAERVRSIVQTLRNFSRLDESDLKVANLNEGLENTLILLAHRLKPTAERPAIAIVRDYGELPLVECYPGLLNQAFLSILTNAVDALDTASWGQVNDSAEQDGSVPMIRLMSEIAPNDTAMIAITNNGPPIPAKICDRIFDPFFTTKPVGKGTGLGLSTAHAIVVEHHGGQLTHASSVHGETTFTIQIPLVQPKGAATAKP